MLVLYVFVSFSPYCAFTQLSLPDDWVFMYRFLMFFSFSSCCIGDRLAVHCESGCLYQFTLLFVKTWFFSVVNCVTLYPAHLLSLVW